TRAVPDAILMDAMARLYPGPAGRSRFLVSMKDSCVGAEMRLHPGPDAREALDVREEIAEGPPHRRGGAARRDGRAARLRLRTVVVAQRRHRRGPARRGRAGPRGRRAGGPGRAPAPPRPGPGEGGRPRAAPAAARSGPDR